MNVANVIFVICCIGVIAFVVFVVYRKEFHKPSQKTGATKKPDKYKLPDWIKKPWAYIIPILIVFNFIIWIKIPWLWSLIYDNIFGIFVLNLLVWLIFFLRTIKSKDVSGVEIKNPTCSLFSNIALAIFIVAFLTGAFKNQDKIFETETKKITKDVYVPVNKWSVGVIVPYGYRFSWDDDIKHVFKAKNNSGKEITLNPDDPESKNLSLGNSSEYIQFQSMDSPFEIKVTMYKSR